jgi:hypothetical protein
MLKNQSRSREFVPNIVLTNVMSLLPKIDEIRVFTETHSIDLFFISETWLKSNVGDDQLILPGYNLERLDRVGEARGRMRRREKESEGKWEGRESSRRYLGGRARVGELRRRMRRSADAKF